MAQGRVDRGREWGSGATSTNRGGGQREGWEYCFLSELWGRQQILS